MATSLVNKVFQRLFSGLESICTAQPISTHPNTHQNTAASPMLSAESDPKAVLSLGTVGEHGQNHAEEQPQLHSLVYFRTADVSVPWSWLVPVLFKGKICCIRTKTLSRPEISNTKLKGGLESG